MIKLRCAILLILLLIYLSSIHALNDMPLLAQLQGEHNMSSFGRKIVSLDFNHDGYDDLIVLSPGYGYVYPYTPSRGKVYIYFGGPGFSSTSEPAMTLEGDYPDGNQRRITLIRNIGDVNGDGFDDLLICDAIPGPSGFYVAGSERYMFFYGGTGDLSSPDRIELPLAGANFGPYFKLGDVDGDGFDDVGIFYKFGWRPYFDIMWGGSFTRQNLLSLDFSSMSVDGSIIGIGDINGDGYDDFSIGYLGEEQGDVRYSTIRIYYGNSSRVFNDYTLLVDTPISITRKCIALGDLNNDGFDDFMGYSDSRGMNVWLGTDTGITLEPDVSLNPRYFGDSGMYGLKHGDFNGDGFSDVIGADYHYGAQRFAIWIGSENMDGFADWQKVNALENFGYDVAVGDFNGDGCDDIAISAPFEQGSWPYHDFRGYVLVYAGNPGLVANDDTSIPSISSSLVMNLSPNPITKSAQYLNVDLNDGTLNKGDQITLEIFNIKGQSILSETYQAQTGPRTLQISTSSFRNGVHICRVSSGKNKTISKFTVIK